ncbi:AB hydrolase-1 domain-containing protein [Heracleum sosnowskyi]|uniref:AB hydrolase-1 domain-containing protein n=1 Tax=Heracleum sosnowskyi TaxID=360622 RepID=A0AAD8GZF3_9APIA|nr:AB hydrolase-1 domain-containing protein [Heracleum sosnowskyi]
MATHCLALATTLYPRMTIIPRATLNRDYKMRVPYELKQGQSRLFHQLPSGLNMEVIYQKAWCWAQHWLPFFSANGYDCYALSLLGQGESDEPSGPVAGSLETHAGNVADFIGKETKIPPVLLGHSFGGLIVQYYIANTQPRDLSEIERLHPELHGAVLVCSVPPSGNSGLVWRYLFSNPIAAFKVTRSLAAKAFQTSLPLCRETFFSAAMEDNLVLRYQKLMTESSRLPLFDLRKLNASLPVPAVRDPSLQILVLGANDDFIVDAKGISETGIFYGVEPVCIEGVAHDMMLDTSWEKGAEYILQWLSELKREERRQIDERR